MTELAGAFIIEVQDLLEQFRHYPPNTKVHIRLHHDGDLDCEDDNDLPVCRIEPTGIGIGLCVDVPPEPKQN